MATDPVTAALNRLSPNLGNNLDSGANILQQGIAGAINPLLNNATNATGNAITSAAKGVDSVFQGLPDDLSAVGKALASLNGQKILSSLAQSLPQSSINPQKNADMGRLIYNRQGWRAWFAAPKSLRAGK